METKKCRKCSIEKLLSEFAKCSRATGPVGKGVVGTCKECFGRYLKEEYYPSVKEKYRLYYQQHKSEIRNKLIYRKYGITAAQYDAMLAAQGGHCAICPATEPSGRGKLFHVDHDHVTGRVRGLLCHACNTVLTEHFERFMAAFIAYLTRTPMIQ